MDRGEFCCTPRAGAAAATLFSSLIERENRKERDFRRSESICQTNPATRRWSMQQAEEDVISARKRLLSGCRSPDSFMPALRQAREARDLTAFLYQAEC
jgi:hypothetical protein